jgi:hypothetical protein
MARLEVDDGSHTRQASVRMDTAVNRMVSLAKDGWSKIKGIIEGKRLVREKDSGRVLLQDQELIEGDGGVVMEEWDEGKMGGVVEIEEVDEALNEEPGGESKDSGKRGQGFEFLEELQGEEKEVELEKKRQEGRKRKREVGTGETETGLGSRPGWKSREKESMDSGRLWRDVGRWEQSEDGGMAFKEEKERIPLPENYRLGLDGRGEFLNNSNKGNNNFGLNKTGLFPDVAGGRKETKNWISRFTKSGCISCRNEEGKVNHKRRDGTPVVLVVGDESVPTVVGHTGENSKEATCAWVMKKEHMTLDEVAGILDKINREKKESDSQRGKRTHEFFIPNGSKILVGSFVHLRREGLEGYVADFNAMVKEVRSVTGDCGIEVVPVAPVVFEGIDNMGKSLISGSNGSVRKVEGWTLGS